MSGVTNIRPGLAIGMRVSSKFLAALQEHFADTNINPSIPIKMKFHMNDRDNKTGDLTVMCRVDVASLCEEDSVNNNDVYSTPAIQITKLEHNNKTVGIGEKSLIELSSMHEPLLMDLLNESAKLESELDKSPPNEQTWVHIWEREPKVWQFLWDGVVRPHLKELDEIEGEERGEIIFPNTAIHPYGVKKPWISTNKQGQQKTAAWEEEEKKWGEKWNEVKFESFRYGQKYVG